MEGFPFLPFPQKWSLIRLTYIHKESEQEDTSRMESLVTSTLRIISASNLRLNRLTGAIVTRFGRTG